MRPPSRDVDDEAESARVVLERGVVHASFIADPLP
jgi:hypothetical protein